MATVAVAAIFERGSERGSISPWKIALPQLAAKRAANGRLPGPERWSKQEVRSVSRMAPEGSGSEAEPWAEARQAGQGQEQVRPEGQVKGEPGTALAGQPAGKEQRALMEQRALTELAARCLAGDAAAWEQLARSQHRRIYGICYRFTGSASDAEDLTQEVFLKMYRNLASFDAAKGGFTTWLTTLTRNLLVDNYRRTRMDRVSDSLDEPFGGAEDGAGSGPAGGGGTRAERLADSGRSQEQHVAGLELKAQIQAALKQVSPELREAVILRDLEDMDYKEIAEVLGIPQGTVKSRISRGRAELARLLQRIEGQVM